MSREPSADNTCHRSQQARCWYSVGTMYASIMIARDCFRSANMLIYTRCKMNHVDDTPCGNTCYKVARKQVNTEKEKHMDLYFATCKLIVLLI